MSGQQDSNLRSPAPKAGAMTGLRYAPFNFLNPVGQGFASLRREGDSNPRYPYEYDSLANCWFQPLTHLSVSLAPTSVVHRWDCKNTKSFCSAKLFLLFYLKKELFKILNLITSMFSLMAFLLNDPFLLFRF